MFWASSNYTGVLEKLLKWHSDVGEESTKCATFKIQAVEAENLWVFVGIVKGDAKLRIFYSMLKYNDLFVAKNISGNVIVFMGERPLEGRMWIFKIPRENPWAWPEIKSLSNQIEMKKYFSQEENRHAMWDTTGMTNLTTLRLPRLAVVPHAVADWLSKKGRTPNELRIWLEKMMRTDVNYIKEYWYLFFAFSMAEEQTTKKSVSWPWNWNQSPSQTQNFGNG